MIMAIIENLINFKVMIIKWSKLIIGSQWKSNYDRVGRKLILECQ